MKAIAPKVFLCIVGLLCLLIGVYIVWELCKFCQNHFQDPAQTDPPPAPSLSNVVSESAWFLQPPSQSQASVAADSAPANPCDCGCSFSFTLLVIGSHVVLTNAFVPVSETEETFRAQLASAGIASTGASSHPSDIQDVNGVLTVMGPDMVTVVIERTLGTVWEAIQTNAFPRERAIVSTVDGPCSNAFFRVKQL